MKKISMLLSFLLISGCVANVKNKHEKFTKDNVSSVVLAADYKRGQGPSGISDEFDLNGKLLAVFALRSDELKAFNNMHSARVEYYENDKLVHDHGNYRFNMKDSPWYIWLTTNRINLGEGDFIAKFYIDDNFIEQKAFTITQ